MGGYLNVPGGRLDILPGIGPRLQLRHTVSEGFDLGLRAGQVLGKGLIAALDAAQLFFQGFVGNLRPLAIAA